MSAALSAGRAAPELLARILHAEASHRGLRAVEALAALALNRRRAALEGGEAARMRFAGGAPLGTPDRMLIAVCRAPFQFPVRHPRHPRHALFAVPPGGDAAAAAPMEMCRRVAARAASGMLPDPTGGALLWHDDARLPDWALGRVPLAEAGGLAFYAG